MKGPFLSVVSLSVAIAGCASSESSSRGPTRPRAGEPPPGVCESPEANLPEGVPLVHRHTPTPKLPRGTAFRFGYACVLATIDTRGEVAEVKLLSHSDRPFADEFVRIVGTWTFDPILVGGVPTEVRTVLTASFKQGL